ncbi:ADP-ribosylglycohydrolase family protein [Cetobacterium sp. SF1]|uniref:ADP-ribosylglycohydrolase family protein n=1 Tax=Cetobacterium sp. SF1 TaxID=3417654 RepID=UPI003CFB956B
MKNEIDKIKDTIRLCFGADAYSLGYQWTYDITGNLEQFEKTGLKLIDPMAIKYHPARKAGDISFYGDQQLALLESLDETKAYSEARFLEIWENIWRIGYNDWIDGATKIRLASKHPSNSSDLSPVSRIAPLFLIKDLTLKEMQDIVEQYIGVTHNNLEVKDFGKFIVHLIYELQSGGTLMSSINKIKGDYPYCNKYIDKGLDYVHYSWKELLEKEIDTSCPIEASGPLAIYLLCKYLDSPSDMFAYNNIFDGDTCGRVGILALVTGLIKGFPACGDQWYGQLKKKDLLEKVLAKF